VSAFASPASSPLTESGDAIGLARAIAAFIRADAGRLGTSTGVPRIASIDVASAIFPPYSLTDCEIAPITRCTPAASGQ
jgi:hypothetical protein